MPRSLNPNSEVRLTLHCDVDRPDQVFIFKCLSMDDERDLANLVDLEKVTNVTELHEGQLTGLAKYMRGWELKDADGEKVPYDLAKLSSLIQTNEAVELAQKLLASGRVSHDEKKSVELQPLSEADCSVNTAQPESAPNK